MSLMRYLYEFSESFIGEVDLLSNETDPFSKRLVGGAALPGSWTVAADRYKLRRIVKEFVESETWAAAQRTVEAHPELLTDAALGVLDEQATSREAHGDFAAANLVRRHYLVLERAREVGVDAAFAERAEAGAAGFTRGSRMAEVMLAFIRADPDQARRVVDDHPELLSGEVDALWDELLPIVGRVVGRAAVETVEHKRRMLRGMRREQPTRAEGGEPEAGTVADLTAADQMPRADLVASLRRRLGQFSVRRDPTVLLEASALAEAAALAHPAADLAADLKAQEAMGALHWARYLALPTGQDEDDFLAACGFLWHAYRRSPRGVPDPVRAALDVAVADGATGPEMFAAGLLSQARLTRNPLALDRCIEYIKHLLRDMRDPQNRTRTQVRVVLNFALHEREGRPAGVVRDESRMVEVLSADIAAAWETRFDRTRDPADLDEAIQAYRETVDRIPIGERNRALAFDNVGRLLIQRFDRTGTAVDLNAAVAAFRQAVDAAVGSFDDLLPALSGNLGSALATRADTDGSSDDLSEAIELFGRVVGSTPVGDRHRPRRLYNLGGALLARYRRTERARDLDRAIGLVRQAIDAIPEGDPDRLKMLDTLAHALRVQDQPKDSDEKLSQRRLELPDSVAEAWDSTPSLLGAPVTNGEPAERYLVGELPSKVEVDNEFSLIVQIRRRPSEPGQHSQPLPLLVVGGSTQVRIIVRAAPGLQILGDTEQEVSVEPHRDSVPLRFSLRATQVGLRRLRVSAWSGGTFLTELTMQTSSDPGRVEADPYRRVAPLGSTEVRPGQVTLLVEVNSGRYSFRWLADRFISSAVLADPLAGPPDAAVERTVETLRKIIARESTYSAANAQRWVRETGVGLWQDMVPDVIKEQFWQLRDSIQALCISCTADWMPWELLYPRAPRQDHGFLVQQFPVVRLVPDQHRAGTMHLDGAYCIVPPRSPNNAKQEVYAVRRALAASGVTLGELGDIEALEELLDVVDSGAAGVLHFACHNGFSIEGGGSSIKMLGGNFVPTLLNTACADITLARRHPLVFINACRSAGVAPYYTRIMGWAEQFMTAGAGAFIGTLWPVESGPAAAFAEAFYASLLNGQTLGAATMNARRAAEDPADPSWLAYAAYGDPNATAATAT